MPEGADAVVQIENTEQLPPGQGAKRRVRIVKVGLLACRGRKTSRWSFASRPQAGLLPLIRPAGARYCLPTS